MDAHDIEDFDNEINEDSDDEDEFKKDGVLDVYGDKLVKVDDLNAAAD